MASDKQRVARIKAKLKQRGLLKPEETLMTKEADLTNDERLILWREFLTRVLPGWREGLAMFPEDKGLQELVTDAADLLQGIMRGDDIDLMPKPYTGPWIFDGKEYATEAEQRAAYEAYAEDERNKATDAYKRKLREEKDLTFYEIPSQG